MPGVHAVADDEEIRAFEADVLGHDRFHHLARLVQQHRHRDAAGAAIDHQFLGEGERAPRFQNVIDDQHVAAGDVAFDIAHQPHLARRLRAGPIARQRNELDFGRHAGAVQGSDQIGGEDEASLEDGDDQQVVVPGCGNLFGQRLVARSDRLSVDQDPEASPPDFRHLQFNPTVCPSRRARARLTSVASAGGEAKALRKPIDSPASSCWRAGSTSHEVMV